MYSVGWAAAWNSFNDPSVDLSGEMYTFMISSTSIHCCFCSVTVQTPTVYRINDKTRTRK